MIKYPFASHEWWVDEPPNECPLCHHAIDPRFLGGVVRQNHPMGKAIVEVLFQCPRTACLHAFIGRYDGEYSRSTNRHDLRLRATTPVNVKVPDQPTEVAAISPQFVAIYAEAAAGEARGLTQIAGGGYRKALEFLVKDFCIAGNAAEAEAIKGEWLGDVIKTRLGDPHIKAMAERATWLGNDEAHYVRRWEDKDLTDLKNVIALTVSWINTHQLTRKYVAEMPAGKKK